MIRIRTAFTAIAATLALAGYPAVQAQPNDIYPSKPIRIVVPYPAGGVADQVARAVQKPMQDFLKQPVVIENIGGAGGVIGTAAVARAPHDGYTLLVGATGPISISAQVSKVPYDVAKDFVPVSLMAHAPLFLAVPAASPAKSVKELIAAAKAAGTSWNYGSVGPESLSHLTGELLNATADLRLTHIPYNGGAQMVTAFVAGDLHVAFVTGPESASLVQSGKIRYLAITTAQRSDLAPGLPTVAETVPGFSSDVWYGIVAPAGTPENVTRRLQEAVAFAVAQPETQRPFAGRYIEIKSSTPAELTEKIRAETTRWARVIKTANIDLK